MPEVATPNTLSVVAGVPTLDNSYTYTSDYPQVVFPIDPTQTSYAIVQVSDYAALQPPLNGAQNALASQVSRSAPQARSVSISWSANLPSGDHKNSEIDLQITWNPYVVQAYRLVDYENRLVNGSVFNTIVNYQVSLRSSATGSSTSVLGNLNISQDPSVALQIIDNSQPPTYGTDSVPTNYSECY
ncbi:MAG: YfbK domain-containing protein [Bdellovibrionota bacterium]